MLFSKQLALGGRVRLRSGVFVAFKEEQNAVLLIHDRCGSLIGSRALMNVLNSTFMNERHEKLRFHERNSEFMNENEY